MEIENAIKLLEKHGYYVGALWSLPDIQDTYKCDDDTAMSVLDKAIEVNMENVWESIHIIAQDMELKKNNNN
mgnify:CR=1 FL=1